MDTSLSKEEQEAIDREEEEKKNAKPPTTYGSGANSELFDHKATSSRWPYTHSLPLSLSIIETASMPAPCAPGVNVFSRKNSKSGSYVSAYGGSTNRVSVPTSMLQTLPKSQSVPANIYQPPMGE